MTENLPTTTTKPKARKITGPDVAALADLMIKSCLNETEACALVGFKPDTFRQWRQRHATEFEGLLSRVRGLHIKNLVAKLEKASDGEGVFARKGPDWRASDRLLLYSDKERFSDARGNIQVNVAPTFSEEAMRRALSAVYGNAPAKQLTNTATHPALPESAQEPEAETEAVNYAVRLAEIRAGRAGQGQGADSQTQ